MSAFPLSKLLVKRYCEQLELDRHLVLCGESLDDGTQVNSLKAVSLINFVVSFWARGRTDEGTSIRSLDLNVVGDLFDMGRGYRHLHAPCQRQAVVLLDYGMRVSSRPGSALRMCVEASGGSTRNKRSTRHRTRQVVRPEGLLAEDGLKPVT